MTGDKAGHLLMFTGTVQQEPQQCLGLCDRSTVESKVFLLETKIKNPKSTHCALIYDGSLFTNVTTEKFRIWKKVKGQKCMAYLYVKLACVSPTQSRNNRESVSCYGKV